MDKKLRKSYECLDLPISATIEEVESREKALIKIYNSKEVEKGISYDKKIGEIEASSKLIIENIKNNGIPQEEHHKFESDWTSIWILSAVLLFAAMLCFFSFYIFL